MPLTDSQFKFIIDAFKPPAASELKAISDAAKPWKNKKLRDLAVKISRLQIKGDGYPKEKWDIIDALQDLDSRITIAPQEEPCSNPTPATPA